MYPVTYAADIPVEGRNRLSTLLRYIYGIPSIIVANDQMPPLSGDEEPGYPVRVGVAEPLGQYSRAKTFFRLVVGIPVWILNYVWQIIALVVVFIAWFAILFTGKMPEGLVKPLHGSLSYQSKALAYALLMTEDWPPFSEDGDVVPAGQIATRTDA